MLAVNGNIKLHPDFEKIIEFCKKYDVEVVSLNNGEIVDVGSIIPVSY
jgi:2-hydroxy-3-keto-5-methylthiopentenyl-1-phosphate phosphatase